VSRAASHVLLIAPVDLRFNPETAESNAFMRRPDTAVAAVLGREAEAQHRALRDLLIENGVAITVVRGRADAPDGPFCNNWFSTHRGPIGAGSVLVLYPLLAPSRRRERRPDLVALLRGRYPRVIDFSDREAGGVFLESTGSLCLDDEAGVAYAALSPRTDRDLAEEWARALGYRLVAFRATDAGGLPYYHTNVMMFIGHGIAGVCLESIPDEGERGTVERTIRESGLALLPITREQVLSFCGNCLALMNDAGERLLLLSSAALAAFTPDQRAALEGRARILATDLSAFEILGGGSARCLVGELV
jgi:hypothetical protein